MPLLYADSIYFNNGVTDPENAFGSPDGVYTSNGAFDSWQASWFLANGGASPGGLVSVNVRARKTAGAGTPEFQYVYLYQGDNPIISFTNQQVTNESGETLTFSVDTALLDGTLNALNVLMYSNGSTEANIQIDAIWLDVPSTRKLHGWNGSAFMPGTLKRFDGTQWTTPPLKKWSGSVWEVVE